ncbi:MAG: sigma-70 family RNA polymerase sigma factor [Patescibacteria group bacterium]
MLQTAQQTRGVPTAVDIYGIYGGLLERARRQGNILSPTVLARYLSKAQHESSREKEAAWLINVVQLHGIRLISDEAYTQVVDSREKRYLHLEERFGVPVETIFGHLYVKMELTLEEISGFLSMSTELTVEFLGACGIPRRENDFTRRQIVEEKTEASEKEPTPPPIAVPPQAGQVDGNVGPLYRDLDASEKRRIANAISFFLHQGELEKAYYMEICRFRMLAAYEEPILARQVRTNRTARDQFILANVRLVYSVANRYWRWQGERLESIELGDLVQEGTIGLMRAVAMFDPERGYKFSTYAMWWIRQSIERAIADTGRNVRIPVHAVENLHKIRKAQYLFNQTHGRGPGMEELVALTGLAVAKIRDVLDASGGTMRLNAPAHNGKDGEDGEELIDLVLVSEAIDPLLLHDARRQRAELKGFEGRLRKTISQLPFEDQVLIGCRFGMFGMPEMTLEAIGARNDLTRERIRQIEGVLLKEIGGDSEATREHLKGMFNRLAILDEVLSYN